MKFILDCPSSNEIAESRLAYLADGFDFSSKVNNSLTTGEKVKMLEKVAKKISPEKSVFIGLQNTTDSRASVAEALELSKANPAASVTLNATLANLELCNSLLAKGLSFSLSPCFSVSQALLFAKAGANYLFLPLGKFDDMAVNGIEVVAEVRGVLDNYPNFLTNLVTRSIRNLIHVNESAKIRSDAICLSGDLFNKMINSSFI